MTQILTPEQLEKKRAYNRSYSKSSWRSRGRTEEEKKRNAISSKKYQQSNPEKVRQYRREYHQKNRDRVRQVQKIWNINNRSRKREREKSWRMENLDHQHDMERNLRRRRKQEMIAAYGGACSCCRESRFEFLSVDHIDGRKKHGHSKSMSGIKLYAWLKKNDYPQEDFRCLCMNCNTSFGFYGYCPHERERKIRERFDQVAAD
jgi:hypothetical protein